MKVENSKRKASGATTKAVVIKKTDLWDRKGYLVFQMENLFNSDIDILKATFSEFYPVDIDRDHRSHFYDSLKYLGISPHFDIVEQGTIPPRYDVIIEKDNDVVVSVKFKKFEIQY